MGNATAHLCRTCNYDLMGIAVGAPCPECATPAHSPDGPPTWQNQSRRVHWCWRLGGLALMAGMVISLAYFGLLLTLAREISMLAIDGDRGIRFTQSLILSSMTTLPALAYLLLSVPTTLLPKWQHVVAVLCFLGCLVLGVAACVAGAGFQVLQSAPRWWYGTDLSRACHYSLFNLHQVAKVGLDVAPVLAGISLVLVARRIPSRSLFWLVCLSAALTAVRVVSRWVLPSEALRSSWMWVLELAPFATIIVVGFVTWHRGWIALRTRPLS